ncbi:class I tRNA ligase family protein, partial [Candidatus Parcubacteria bacterium]|nr:class I tRNA ligase family protein [Candidatus Parcubacteria bacterium]
KKIPGKNKTLKDLAIAAVKSKDIKIVPNKFEKTYYHWMENLHDWCISRQIWWGHRIPVWYTEDGEVIVAPNETEANKKAGNKKLTQDKDTLDTWFSSSLWTFSTLGWPIQNKIGLDKDLVKIVESGEKTKTYRLADKGYSIGETIVVENTQTKKNFGYIKITNIQKIKFKDVDPKQKGHEEYKDKDDFKKTFKKYYPDKDITDNTDLWAYDFVYSKKSDLDLFHPSSVMETGYDILFFWVARMIMMTEYVLETKPFDTVYLHGMIRDKDGKKMSKSLGNGIDPIKMSEKFGTDALRLSLIIGSAPGADMRLYEDKIAGYRNFVNKLWNISRFIFTSADNVKRVKKQPRAKTLADKWILSEFNETIKEISEDLEKFHFSEAGTKLYHFTWDDLADWYLEISKIEKDKEEILLYILERLLVLCHPFIPFVTEVIWEQFGEKELMMVKEWPKAGKVDKDVITNFTELKELVVSLRNLKAENKIPPTEFPDCNLDSKILDKKYLELAAKMARVNLTDKKVNVKPIAINSSKVFIDLTKELSDKEKQDLEKYIKNTEAKLANEKFVSNAPPQVIEDTKKRLAEAKNKVNGQ